MSAGEFIYHISLHSGLLGSYKIHVTKLDLLSTGKAAAQPAQPAQPVDGEVTSQDSIVYAGNNAGIPLLVWTDKAFKTVKIHVIGSKQVTTVNVTPKAGEMVDKIIVHAAGSSDAHPHFLIHYQSTHSNWAEVFHVKDNKALKAFDLPQVGGKGAFSTSSLANEVYLIRYTSLEVTLYSSKAATVLSQWSIQSETSDVQDPIHGTSEVVMRAGAKYSLRSALALTSGDWELVRNGDRLWSRSEGLTGIVAAGFVDFTREGDLLEALASESQRDLLGAYIHRVKRHAKQMQHFPDWLRGLSDRILPNFWGGKADLEAQAALNQVFGFNKIVIVATESGRLAALDTGQHGKVLWTIQAVNVPTGQTWDVLSIDPEESSALVRGNGGEFLRVTTSTGTVLAYQPGAMISSLKTSIPVADSRGLNGLIQINRDGSLGNLANADFADSTIIVTEGDDSTVRGWRLSKNGKSTLAWQFVPGAREHVQSVRRPPAHDPVASIGKALGDRNVLYKYLNPNILLITTLGIQTSTANFYIVDSTSGAVLHSAVHTDVDTSQPISSTLTENWFAYSLFSEPKALSEDLTQIEQKSTKGYQLIISELFESPYPNDRGPQGEFGNVSSTGSLFTGEDEMDVHPHVISQIFLLPGPISHMTTTSTLQGITPRSVLCALPQSNALMSIPRHFLDARRPVGREPTSLEAEEGLFKYSPVLEFEPKWLLSHKRDLFGISDVITSPSKLESTSLVFAYGDVDIFGTRVSPIGSFDMLGKGFSKLQLVGTVVALAIGTSLLAPFVSFSPPLPMSQRVLTNDYSGQEKADRWTMESLIEMCAIYRIAIDFQKDAYSLISLLAVVLKRHLTPSLDSNRPFQEVLVITYEGHNANNSFIKRHLVDLLRSAVRKVGELVKNCKGGARFFSCSVSLMRARLRPSQDEFAGGLW